MNLEVCVLQEACETFIYLDNSQLTGDLCTKLWKITLRICLMTKEAQVWQLSSIIATVILFSYLVLKWAFYGFSHEPKL